YDAEAIVEMAQYGRSTETARIWSRSGVPAEVANRPDGSTTTPGDGGSRNRRSVWTIATEAYADAHFATFPTALVEPCILAGSRPGDIVLDPFMGSGTV